MKCRRLRKSVNARRLNQFSEQAAAKSQFAEMSHACYLLEWFVEDYLDQKIPADINNNGLWVEIKGSPKTHSLEISEIGCCR